MDKDTYRTIGERIKFYRSNRGYSQGELAEGICSRQTISLLENGVHIPSSEILRKVAERLHVSLHDVLADESTALESKVRLEMMKVYVETEDYAHALELVDTLEQGDELLEYQKRDVILYKAECLLRTDRADEAVEILLELQESLESQRETDDHLLAVVHDKLGSAYYALSRIETAYAYYMRAHQFAKRLPEHDVTAAKITYNLGKSLRMIDRPDEAIDFLVAAKEYFDQSTDMQRLAMTMFELGIAYQARNQQEQAEACIRKARVLYESLQHLNMARRVKESYAYTILAEREPSRAIQDMLECAAEWEAERDDVQLAYTYARIAKLAMQQEFMAEAEQHLRNALQRFREDEADQRFEYATVYQMYAEYLLRNKDFEKCVAHARRAAYTFVKMGLGRDAANSLKLVVQAYREQGRFEEALDEAEKVSEILGQSWNRI